MTPAEPASEPPADRKAVLFCPVCEYEAPVDGAWSVESREAVANHRIEVTCPECGHVVVSQPRFESDDDDQTMVRPLLQLVNSVVRNDVL